jgi:Reductase C-terminal
MLPSIMGEQLQTTSSKGTHLRVSCDVGLRLIVGYTSTAYFWSAQGAQMRYCGTTAIDGFDDVIVQGSTDPNSPKFSAFYVKDNKVIAVVSIGTDPTVSLSAELFYGIALVKLNANLLEGRFPPVDVLKSGMDIRQMDLYGTAA